MSTQLASITIPGLPHPVTAHNVPGKTSLLDSGKQTGLTSGEGVNGRSNFNNATSASNVFGSKSG